MNGILNRNKFVPAKYRQPDYYERIFEDWTAVYKIGRFEYHVQLVGDGQDKKTARSIEILSQSADCRNVLVSGIPSVKQALERLEKIIGSVGKQ